MPSLFPEERKRITAAETMPLKRAAGEEKRHGGIMSADEGYTLEEIYDAMQAGADDEDDEDDEAGIDDICDACGDWEPCDCTLQIMRDIEDDYDPGADDPYGCAPADKGAGSRV